MIEDDIEDEDIPLGKGHHHRRRRKRLLKRLARYKTRLVTQLLVSAWMAKVTLPPLRTDNRYVPSPAPPTPLPCAHTLKHTHIVINLFIGIH